MSKRQRVIFVNRLRISKGYDGIFRVRTPTVITKRGKVKPPHIIHDAPTEEEAYNWAHHHRKYAKKEPPWAQYELEYLDENYGRLPKEEIAKKLRRSVNSLKIITFRKLGINQKSNIYTARLLARELGVSCAKIIVAWYDKGYLKGRLAPFSNGPNNVWWFEYEDIIECLTKRPWLCNPKKMPLSYFRSIVLYQWEKNRWYTRQEASYYLNLTTTGPIERYIRWGLLPAVRRPRGGGMGQWIIMHSDLAEFQLNDPRVDHRKALTLPKTIDKEMEKAEKRAWHWLARHHYHRFGYWASVWAKLNSMNRRQKNVFADLVELAKFKKGGDEDKDEETLLTLGVFGRTPKDSLREEAEANIV